MPLVVRLFVRSALAWLLVGSLGAALLLIDVLPSAWAGALSVSVTHMLTLGWASQLIFGVALWMFPLLGKPTPRGPAWLTWTTYICLNSGLLVRIVSEPVQRSGGDVGLLPLTAALLQTLAVWCFVAAIWARVRERAPRAAGGN